MKINENTTDKNGRINSPKPHHQIISVTIKFSSLKNRKIVIKNFYSLFKCYFIVLHMLNDI